MQKKTQAAVILVIATAAALIGSPALAEPQQNRDWGKVASNLARLDTDHSTAADGTDANGGAMGQHARSTQAADNNGGFTATGSNGFGITFNVKEDGEQSAGRLGVGNATRGAPHNSEPGDGGNGVHAINNANAAGILDPVTGDFVGGDVPDFSEELLEGTSADPTP